MSSGTKVFGLTGGLGSGKSSAARVFARCGLPVLDADQLARAAVAPGSSGLRQVQEAFGSEIVGPEGLRRQRLGALVFSDSAALERLEAITHPIVRSLYLERVEQLSAAGEPLAAYDVPLLFEKGLQAGLRPVVVVWATPEQQVERAGARDGLTPARARERIRAQMTLAEKRKLADYVIDNSSTPAAMEAAARQVLARVCLHCGVDPKRYGLG